MWDSIPKKVGGSREEVINRVICLLDSCLRRLESLRRSTPSQSETLERPNAIRAVQASDGQKASIGYGVSVLHVLCEKETHTCVANI